MTSGSLFRFHSVRSVAPTPFAVRRIWFGVTTLRSATSGFATATRLISSEMMRSLFCPDSSDSSDAAPTERSMRIVAGDAAVGPGWALSVAKRSKPASVGSISAPPPC